MHRLLLVSLGSLLLAMPPQQPEPAKQTSPQPEAPKQQEPAVTFRGGVTDVELAVTVTDEKGKFLSNLTKSDFRVLDEGKPQRINFFSHTEKQPIVAGFLIDQSNNMKIHWDKYKDAILEMIWGLMPGDPQYQGYLISYGSQAELSVNTTEDPDKMAAAVRRMKPGGGAALFDAIYRACTDRKLIKGEPYEPRRVIIIVGDGHDSASKHSQGEVLELAKRNMVSIYAISSMSFGFDNIDMDVLEKLTKETGGHVEYPLNNLYKGVSGYLSNPSDDGNYALTVGTGGYAAEISSGIIKAVGGIAGEITTQYILRYTPDIDPEEKPKAFRRIRVEIPELPNTIIRARDGYYPNPVPGSTPTKN
jgi:Ca-activated chloride channel family protein